MWVNLKTVLRLSFTLSSILFTSQALTFEVSGESFPADFKMTSWSSTTSSSSMTAEGIVGEGYGKVYLNYEFKSNGTDRNKG